MTLGPDEIRAAADRVLAAQGFRRSARLSRFLRFVVDSALEGRPERLKEYVLGIEVYEKGTDFDPRIDSTVRVEAARLRAKLREYYETEGRDDGIRIELPKGAYAPTFRRFRPAAPWLAGRRPAMALWIAALVLMAGIGALVILPFLSRGTSSTAILVKPLTAWAGREIQACFSPDGKQIAMVWSGENDDNLDIYVRPVEHGPPVRLTWHPAPDRSPTWSPQGRFIAFARDSAANVELYLVPAEGGAERRVAQLHRATVHRATGPPVSRFLDWLPQGEALIVSDQDSPEEPFALFRLSADTGERLRITSPPTKSVGDGQPAVSPDGRRLAFVRSPDHPLGDIYLASISGGEPRRLTFENQVITGIAWSEDGRSIVFSSERGATAGAGSLWRVGVGDSSAPARIDQVHGIGPRATWPAIARRGRLLAYQEMFQDTNLWRVASGGGKPERVISSTREEILPAYSPDGARIAFASNRSGNWEIWTANADGSDVRQVTSFGGTPAANPHWSPDGRLIAFDHVCCEGNWDVYTTTPEGYSLRRLTWSSARDETPVWSNDGEWLYFGSNRTGDFEIWKMPVNDPAQATQLTHAGGRWPRESPDGRYLYFRRGPAIWRMPAGGGVQSRVPGPDWPGVHWFPDPTGLYLAVPGRGIAYQAFATRSLRQIAPLPELVNGLALAPDRHWLLYGQLDRAGSDIMLVENFR